MLGFLEKKKICLKCHGEIYLTSIEKRFYRESKKITPLLCWLCNRRENAAVALAATLELQQVNDR